MKKEKLFTNNSGKKQHLWSIIFLIIVIILTLSLFWYNIYLEKKSEELTTKVKELENSIKEVESDDSFKVFSLIDANKKVLKELEKRTKITNYIQHLYFLKQEYDLNFKWFSAWNWEIQTSISLLSDDNWVAYKKLVNFISEYRKDKNALFELKFINRVLWYDNMKVNIDFKIK